MNINTEKLLAVDARRDKLYVALDGEDDLGIVLRSHIYLEHEIKEFILASASNPKQIKFSDFDYDKVVALALALGLDPSLKAPLLAIGNLRNRFAHNLDMALTRQEANNIYNTLSAAMKADIQQGYAKARKSAEWEHLRLPKSMKDAPPRRLFGGCMVELQIQVLRNICDVYDRVHHGRENQKS